MLLTQLPQIRMASPSLYEVELNTTENQVTETVIYGNIQLVKHTDDLDPDEVKNPEFQKEIKTADFQWAYETEELALRVDYYAMNQNLYVELYSKEDGAWEPFSDLTVNLPGYCLEPGTACISGDFSKENIQFIQEHGLGTLLPWKAQSGMGQYAVVKFHLEELRKFDQAGVAAFCNQHGLQKTMQEERRQSR